MDVRIIHVASRLAVNLPISSRNEAHLFLSGLLPSRTLLIRRCAFLLDRVIRNPSVRIFDRIRSEFPSIMECNPVVEVPKVYEDIRITGCWRAPESWEGIPSRPIPQYVSSWYGTSVEFRRTPPSWAPASPVRWCLNLFSHLGLGNSPLITHLQLLTCLERMGGLV